MCRHNGKRTGTKTTGTRQLSRREESSTGRTTHTTIKHKTPHKARTPHSQQWTAPRRETPRNMNKARRHERGARIRTHSAVTTPTQHLKPPVDAPTHGHSHGPACTTQPKAKPVLGNQLRPILGARTSFIHFMHASRIRAPTPSSACVPVSRGWAERRHMSEGSPRGAQIGEITAHARCTRQPTV